MHFEILVEDQSGKTMLDIIIPKIIGVSHTFKVIPYKGVGRIPKKQRSGSDANKRILLDNLPRLLKGYGQSWQNYPAVVFVICDLDNRCLKAFRQELLGVLNSCIYKPKTRFCIAIEEGEAWLLGDINAIKSSYPRAKQAILTAYRNDSICGTWEKVADAVYDGGAAALARKGWQAVGKEKAEWAKNIAPNLDLGNNNSPSFNYFRDKLLELVEANV